MKPPEGEPEQSLFPVWIDPQHSLDFKLKGHFVKEPQLQKPFELELEARSAKTGFTASRAIGISNLQKRPVPIPPLKDDRIYSWGVWKGLACLRSLCAESEIKTGPSFFFDLGSAKLI